MAKSFDDLLNGLHSQAHLSDADFVSSNEGKAIKINEKRQFIVPENYNTIIAYEGDINSQIITFECPNFHEGHNLRRCNYKYLRWKHLISKKEGKAALVNNLLDPSSFGLEVTEYGRIKYPNDGAAHYATVTLSQGTYTISSNDYIFISTNDESIRNQTFTLKQESTLEVIIAGDAIDYKDGFLFEIMLNPGEVAFPFVPYGDVEESYLLQWFPAPEVFAQAGNIEISLSLYDIDSDTKEKAFAWNTASYSGFSVAPTMSSVGFDFPAKDEILTIDAETRNILAPAGYNNVICNYGDYGVAKVYFLIDRYLGKEKIIDVFDEGTKVYIYTSHYISKEGKSYSAELKKKLYSSEIGDRQQEGLVFLEWEPERGFTNGYIGTPGKFDIYLSVETNEACWSTNTYKNLALGEHNFG